MHRRNTSPFHLLFLLIIGVVFGFACPLRAVSVSSFYKFAEPEPFYEGGVARTSDGSLYTLVTNSAATLVRFAPSGEVTKFPIAGLSDEAISGPLLLADDGNFYGVILGGSLPSSPHGSLYRLTPDGVLSLLHVFTGEADGTYPQPGLVQGADGALYGATGYDYNVSSYPAGDAGTVFRCTLDGTLTTLHRFPGGANAPVPLGPLTVGHDGDLYGIASSVLFRLTIAGDYTALHDFKTGVTTEYPQPGFTQDATGNFYGTTNSGGSDDPAHPFALGTVFRFDPTGLVTTIYRFNGQEGAAHPVGPLSPGPDGNFYGVLSNGGDDIGINFEEGGALLRVTPAGQVSVVYHDHTDTGLRYAPVGLTAGADGNLYVFTPNGLLRVELTGPGSLGLTNDTFRVEASDGFAYVNFYRTDDTHGAVSVDYATADDTAHAGTDYIASSGTVRWADGDSELKTVRIALPAVASTEFATSKQFTVQLSQPEGSAALLLATRGTVMIGNSTYGPPGVGASSLFTFSGGVDGATIRTLFPTPGGSLVAATISSGYDGDKSTIFRRDADGSLHLLADSVFLENTALAQGPDGNFYGTRFLPNHSNPTICRLSPDGTLTPLIDLGPSASVGYDSFYRALVPARDGSFYAAVEEGSYNTAHKIRIFHVAADGTQTNLHTLAGNDPVYLLEGSDGQLYGVRYYDATYHNGFVFRASLTGDYQVLHDFANDPTGPGRPTTPLYPAANGRLYGLANPADGSDRTVFYQLNSNNGKSKILHSFVHREGIPNMDFVAGTDGNFYGTLSSNAVSDGTTLYRLTRKGELTDLHYTGESSRVLQLLAFGSSGMAYLTDGYNSGRDLYMVDTTAQTKPALEVHALGGSTLSNGTKAHALITRTGNLGLPLTLSYTLNGTARSGVDYQPLSGTVTIPAGRVDGRIAIKSYSLPYGIFTPTQAYTLGLTLTPATDRSYQLSPESTSVEFTINGATD